MSFLLILLKIFSWHVFLDLPGISHYRNRHYNFITTDNENSLQTVYSS